MSANKIHSDFENPIDYYLLLLCEKVAPAFKSVHFTPNQITVIGTVFGLLAGYYIWKQKPFLAVAMLWISYFFDCLDGYYARRYDMCSKFGDYFDHIRDVTVNILIIFLLYRKLDTKTRVIISVILVVSVMLMMTHLGCQERNSNKTECNDSLQFLQKLCPDRSMIKWTRFFGCGTYNLLVLSGLIIYSCYAQSQSADSLSSPLPLNPVALNVKPTANKTSSSTKKSFAKKSFAKKSFAKK
jgi:phosphatidylglycerophosphate synthase